MIAFDGEVWVIGGFEEGLTVTNQTWIFDGDDWREGPRAPARLTHVNAAVWDGRLYLLGGLVGRDLEPTGDAWVLSGDRTVFAPLAPMPAGAERGAAATIATADGIVVAGGANVEAALASVLVYAPASDAWSTAPDLPSPRSHPIGAVDLDGAPLVVGGLETLDATDPLAEVVALDDGAWHLRAPMPTARGGCSAAVIDGVLYCAGGEAGSSVVRVTEAYDLVADRWIGASPMPLGRGGTGGAALGDLLVVPGGAHRLAWEPTADVDVYDPNR